MRRFLPLILVLMLCFSLVSLGQWEVAGVGRIQSLESLGDKGELWFRGTPSGKGDSFVGGYSLSLLTGECVSCLASEPVPNPFGWSWRAFGMGRGVQAAALWGLRREPTDATGQNWVMRLLWQGGDGLQTMMGESTWRELWVREEEGNRELWVYRGAGEGLWKRRWPSGPGAMTEEIVEALPKDTGMRPVRTDDGLVYLSQEEQEQMGLRRQNLTTGENALVELLGRRQELGVYSGEYQANLFWIAASSAGDALAYPAVDGARGMRLRLATLQKDGTWKYSWISPGKAWEPAFSQDGRFLLFRTETTLCLWDRQAEALQILAEELSFPEVTAQSGPHCLFSPNGRFAAWLDKEGELFSRDLGARIGVENSLVHVPTGGREISLGIGLGGSEETTTLHWEMGEGSDPVPFAILSSTGAEILPGEEVSRETLPWSVAATTPGKTGQVILRLGLDSGDACALTLLFTDFRCLTDGLSSSETLYRYPALFFPQDGLLQTVTNAPLAGEAAEEPFLYGRETHAGASWSLFSPGEAVTWAQGCPQASFWIREKDGALFRNGVCVEASPHLQEPGALAVSRNGAVAALLATGELRFSSDGGASWESLSASATSPFLSANGTTLLWQEGTKLMGRLGGAGATPVSLSPRSVAVLWGMTQDGGKVLFQEEGGAFYLLQAPFSASASRLTLLPLPEDATQLCLSANGRRLAFLYVPEGESRQRVGVWDLLSDSPEVVCLAPEAVLPPRSLAISPSGRQIAFSTCADMEQGGREPAENGHWNLYLWEDPLWSNRAPQFSITALNPLTEDAPETNLRLTPLLDEDGDGVALWVVVPPAQGTLRLAPPDTRLSFPRVYYQGNPDFHGTDSFTLGLSDGEWEGTAAWNLTITPVNDPPCWPQDFPQLLTLTGGEERELALSAQDPDLADDPPDVLTYSLDEGSPAWVTVGQEGGQEGWLRLTPPLTALPGEYSLTLRVTDQAGETAATTLLIQLQPLPELSVSSALLRDASLAPQAPATPQEKMLAALAGCWQEIPLVRYSALSLPGDVSLAALRQALDTTAIYVYDHGAFVPLREEGILPGGTGFWVLPGPAWEEGEGSLRLTPASARPAGLPFTGPLLGEETPPQGSSWAPTPEGWQRTERWQMGRAYFLEALPHE